MRIASWNINSVRLRQGLVADYLNRMQPDVLCLQEIKCQDHQFPYKTFRKLGYAHIAVRGQKGYHGVATLSRLPLVECEVPKICRMGDARVLVTTIGGVTVENYYVPAGADIPDPEANPKFAHKLDFLDTMKSRFAEHRARLDSEPVIILGDLNIAPLEADVWSHKQLLDVVSHTPIETEGLEAARELGGFTDASRAALGPDEKHFTWWSYRAKEWRASNRGRRLDHIWLSGGAVARFGAPDRSRYGTLEEARDWEKPSDHIPIHVDLG
jgi:exodeoxyribonuclease III